MAIIIGLNAKLFYNSGPDFATPTWVELTNVTDVSQSLEKALADVTTRGNAGWRAQVGTLKDGTVEFSMMADEEDAGYMFIRDAFQNDSNVDIVLADGDMADTGTNYWRGQMQVTNFSRNEPLEEAVTNDVTLVPTYVTDPAQSPHWGSTPIS